MSKVILFEVGPSLQKMFCVVFKKKNKVYLSMIIGEGLYPGFYFKLPGLIF